MINGRDVKLMAIGRDNRYPKFIGSPITRGSETKKEITIKGANIAVNVIANFL